MASPFPGMDPYLEDRVKWPDVHVRLIDYRRSVSPPALPEAEEN
jgi:hypothetical protein